MAIVGQVKDAINAIQTEAIDLAILDVNLNGEWSSGIADALIDHNIPFVFSTGYGKSAIDGRYRERPILNKPIRKREFAQTLAKLLPGKGSR